jgi:predicted nucleic acid-binding Zn ribbon protein
MGDYSDTSLIPCPKCGTPIPQDAEKCPDCGKDFRSRDGTEDGMEGAGKAGSSYSGADHRTCVKCGGVLEKGFLDDQFSKNVYLDLMWTSGDPEDGESIDRRNFYVTAFRCARCGNLEFKAITKP